MDNLWLCVAITLGMTLVIGLAQPFAQSQMNVLQTACFACASVLGIFLAMRFWSFGNCLANRYGMVCFWSPGFSFPTPVVSRIREKRLQHLNEGSRKKLWANTHEPCFARAFFCALWHSRPHSGCGGFPVLPGPGAAGAGGALRPAAAAAALARLARDVGVEAAAGETYTFWAKGPVV